MHAVDKFVCLTKEELVRLGPRTGSETDHLYQQLWPNVFEGKNPSADIMSMFTVLWYTR